MESRLSQSMDTHWDHEPVQGVGRALRCAPAFGGSLSRSPGRAAGKGLPALPLRFMESRAFQKLDTHWDHEPGQLVGRALRCAPAFGGSLSRSPGRAAGKGLPALPLRFMDRLWSRRRGVIARGVAALFLVFFGMAASPSSRAASGLDESAFDAAAKLYEGGHPADAAAAYERLVSQGVVTPAVLFNQGNAWFHAGKVGRAIVSYRKAALLAPRDEEISTNLARARAKVGAGATTVEGLGVRALRLLTPNEWAMIATAGIWIWFGMLAAAQLAPKFRPITLPLRRPVAATAIALAVLAVVAGGIADRTSAVVVAADTTARFGPLEESQSAFTLPDGAEVVVTDRKGEWLAVRDAAGRRGWVMGRNVGVIR